MYACKRLSCAVLALWLPAQAAMPQVKPAPEQAMAEPTTIGQLSELARSRRIAEQTRSPELAVKPRAEAAMPPGMTIVPSTAILADGAGKPPARKGEPAPEAAPRVLAIVRGPNGARYAEISDGGLPARFATGQVTAGGWTVAAIGAHIVELSRPAAKDGPARRLSLALANQ